MTEDLLQDLEMRVREILVEHDQDLLSAVENSELWDKRPNRDVTIEDLAGEIDDVIVDQLVAYLWDDDLTARDLEGIGIRYFVWRGYDLLRWFQSDVED